MSEPISDEKLMRYLDGELNPADSREVERALAASAPLQTKRDALLEMRDLLRARYEHAEDDAAPELGAMWERVRSALPAPAAVMHAPGLWTRVKDWIESYRSHFVTGAVAAAAGAIVATIVTTRVRAPVGAGAPEAAEVESLEVMGGSGMVFQEAPEKKGDEGSTVIWVTTNDEPDSDNDGVPDTAPSGG